MMADSNRWLKSALIPVAILTGMVLIKLFLHGHLTRFGGFGSSFEDRYIPEIREMGAHIKEDSGGYDGQFYAQIATDPWLDRAEFENAIDEPAYRARRILLPFLAHLIAFGNPELAILVYCSLNILCWYAFALVTWHWLQVDNARTFAKWVACIFSMGVLDSVKYSLTDLPSVLLLLLIIKSLDRFKVVTPIWFALSLFVKETNLLAVAAFPKLKAPFRPDWGDWIKWGSVSIIAVGFFALWYQYVIFQFGIYHGIRGNFDWPLFSMIRNAGAAFSELASGNWNDRFIFRLAAFFGLLFQFAWILSQYKKLQDPLVRIGLAYGILLLFLGDLVWWGYWAVCRVVLPMTIAFNLLYDAKRYFWLGLILANATAIHALYRFL